MTDFQDFVFRLVPPALSLRFYIIKCVNDATYSQSYVMLSQLKDCNFVV